MAGIVTHPRDPTGWYAVLLDNGSRGSLPEVNMRPLSWSSPPERPEALYDPIEPVTPTGETFLSAGPGEYED